MRKSFDAEGLQFGWDSTSIKLAEECLYKYKLSMLDGWTSEGRSVHLFFGGLYATALEHFYKAKANGMDHDQALTFVVREALIASWDYGECEMCHGTGFLDSYDDEGPEKCRQCDHGTRSLGPWVSDHNTKTRENLIRTIIWYLEEFKNDTATVVHRVDGTPMVEQSFAIPVDNGLIFSGHLDRVVNYADQFMVMDQKTTGSAVTAHYFNSFSPDTQMSMYTFAGKAIFNLPIKGVIIDAAQIMVGFTRFERGVTFRSEGQLNEWYDDSMYHIEAARQATRENHFPMNRSSCGNYGGCPFRASCSRDPGVREQFLKAQYVRRPDMWDPLTAR